MQYGVKPSEDRRAGYIVVAVNDDSQGDVFSVLRSGPWKKRAEEHVARKNSEMAVTGEDLMRR